MIGSAAHRRSRRSSPRMGGLARGLLAGCALTFAVAPAAVWAQSGMPELPMGRGLQTDPNARMLLEADELVYDFDREVVSAVGNVRVFYNGYEVEAGRITYHQASGRLVAGDGVRIVEPDGNIITAQEADITDDFAEGFIESINVETVDRTRFAAQSAERREGEVTVFRRGVYTACEPCKDDPTRPPLWQIKASRIIHNQVEKTVTYHHARLEFFGFPVAYFPYFQHPDPTVRRKTGLLIPTVKHKEELGFGVTTPFFWAVTPNSDVTLRPTFYTEQGLLGDAEWRHRLLNGAYSIRLAGILQQDPDAFDKRKGRDPGEREFRGLAQSRGQFELSPQWGFGWHLYTTSDRTFGRDYDLNEDLFVPSTVYLTGMSRRNYFDARGYHFTIQRTDTREADFQTFDALRFTQEVGGGDIDRAITVAKEKNLPILAELQEARLSQRDNIHDLQDEQAVVLPLVDHDYIFDQQVLGGELRVRSNLTSLSRNESDLHVLPPVDYFSGVAGNFSRASTSLSWRRSFIGLGGQEFTPFAYLDGDLFWGDSHDPRAGLRDDEVVGRAMPAVGLEYRWPFLAVSSWGTQTFGPVAQVILRPDEQHIGELPNEDAQSLVFDDSILFDWDKFSGWDRQEGGSRANIGVTYQSQFANGMSVDAIFGQSIHLFGRNSFAVRDVASVGPDTGLETDRSDYVGRVTLDTGNMLSFTARGRFDEDDLEINRTEVSANVRRGRSSAYIGYVTLGENAARGILDNREEIAAAGSVAVTDHWSLLGQYVYDLDASSTVRQAIGLAYQCECLTAAIVYSETNDRFTDLVTNRTVTVRVNLRTLGGTSYTQDVSELLESE